MIEFQVKNYIDRPRLRYDSTSKRLFLDTDNLTNHITLLNGLTGEKVAIWMAESSNANITKVAISSYASTLTQQSNPISSGRETFKVSSEDTVIHKVMYSLYLYDFDSEQYHKIMIQEKLNGSYIL